MIRINIGSERKDTAVDGDFLQTGEAGYVIALI